MLSLLYIVIRDRAAGFSVTQVMQSKRLHRFEFFILEDLLQQCFQNFLYAMLFSYIRSCTEEVVRKIISRTGNAARELASITVNMLLEKNEISDNVLEKNSEFFNLLCL